MSTPTCTLGPLAHRRRRVPPTSSLRGGSPRHSSTSTSGDVGHLGSCSSSDHESRPVDKYNRFPPGPFDGTRRCGEKGPLSVHTSVKIGPKEPGTRDGCSATEQGEWLWSRGRVKGRGWVLFRVLDRHRRLGPSTPSRPPNFPLSHLL